MTTEARTEASSDARPVRVLTVDDQVIFRQVALDVINATPGFEPVGEACNGTEALDAVDRLAPDLVLCDVRMPGLDGFEVASRLAITHPSTVVVLITIEDPMDLPADARRTTASLVVRKQDFGPRLLRHVWSDHAPA